MKVTLIPFCLFLLINATDLYGNEVFKNEISEQNIRTVLFHKEGNPKSVPAIRLNSDEQITLRFDVMGDDYNTFQYRIVHCDFDWQESDLLRTEYMEGRRNAYIDNRQSSFNTHIGYEHYRLTLPNRDFRPTRSGNYALIVYKNNDPDDVVLVRRFFVYQRRSSFTAEVKSPDFGSERMTHQEIEVEIDVDGMNLPDPKNNIKLMLRQNGRWDNAIKNPEPRQFTGNKLVFDYGEGNTFKAGNEFRQFDLRSVRATGQNVNRFVLDSVHHAILYPDPVRGTRSYNKYNDYNGFKLIDMRRKDNPHVEGDYAMVHFFLEQETPIDEDIYVFGALTDWELNDQYSLEFDPEREGYSGRFLFKQGFYNYYYVTRSAGHPAVADHTLMEGNHRETSNDYSVYIYSRQPGDRTHNLIGFRMVTKN